jgi:hypothetical protein
VEKYQELLNLFSDTNYEVYHVTAKSTRTCIMCGGKARVFRDISSRLEYDISALCQKCQDRFFKKS